MVQARSFFGVIIARLHLFRRPIPCFVLLLTPRKYLPLDAFRSLENSHPSKALLATELRRRTTMAMVWIAQELNAGVPQTLWKALRATSAASDNTRDPEGLGRRSEGARGQE